MIQRLTGLGDTSHTASGHGGLHQEGSQSKMAEKSTRTAGMRPKFENIQAHYDLSDDFFALFQDPSRTYSCAYFEPPDLNLEQAQIAKVDLNLDKLDLRPGMTLLDVGCGWGGTMKRAVEKYDVNVIGLTLSTNQHAYSQSLLDEIDTERSRRVLLKGWEEVDEPVDRIVSIEAFEHFGFENYDDFFKTCYDIMPADGRMSIQSSVSFHPYDLNARGKKLTFETARFIKFILTEIFPGGRLPTTDMMVAHGEKAGFTVPEAISLRSHYIKTLKIWGDALEAHHDEAVAIQSEEVYQRYMKYLRGCEYYFTDEALDVSLVSYAKSA
jgi:cyclopropane-fatty-acyl-phospholipid synthase